jgi:hypothetical protein
MATIKAGAKIRNRRLEEVHGTFGCLVHARNDPDTLFILSAAHVIGLNGHAEAGDVIEAEDPPGSDRWVKIGEFERAVPLLDADNVIQICDAALARVTDPTRVSAEIDGIGWPGPVAAEVYRGMPLQFRGAGTGAVGHAMVHSAGVGINAVYQEMLGGERFELAYEDQILYVTDFNTDWSSPTTAMDSGALVLSADRQPVGLHFSRTPASFPVRAAVCTPLKTVLDALQVELVVAGQHAAAPLAAGDSAMPDPDTVGVNGYLAYGVLLRSQLDPHSLLKGVQWYLSAEGLIVDGKLPRSPGTMVTVPRVWNDFSTEILAAALAFKVPVELIVATICTESAGNPNALRTEPGWTSDAATPKKISAGLMQTLISTAREALGDASIDREALFTPSVSINAGTAYIGQKRQLTQFDPPVVACVYNAGGIYANNGPANRWGMRQYPIGTGRHADHFVMWFNDIFTFLRTNRQLLPADTCSFVQLLRG